MWLTAGAVIVGVISLIFLTNKWYNWIYIVRKTWRRDLRALARFYSLNVELRLYERQEKTVPKLFTALVKKHPNKVAFYFEGEAWTYAQADSYSNKIGNIFKDEGFEKGDVVALLLENRPEFLCIWLGLAKIGVVTALINTNLVNEPLIHSINVAHSKAVIFGENFVEAIKNVSLKLEAHKLYVLNEKPETNVPSDPFINLDEKLEKQIDKSLSNYIESGLARDNLIYIYTSGTTGFPKAATINNLRCLFMVLGIYRMVNMNPDDVLYDCLPLYHSAGGMIGACQSLVKGITTVIKKKFSATSFWTDCNKYNCTIVGYVGEICRYLLAVHESSGKPIDHKVRAMFGNGLKPQIWNRFVDRFQVPEIYELYGATEGNANIINIDSTPGAVGFVPRYAMYLYPVGLVKVDEETGEPIRNKDGFCVRCKPHEPGLLIGKITPKKAINDFVGYADKKESDKKKFSNVFRKGDLYFNSGDMLVQDELGYYYFKDRTGDTFRWKGENVATTEIEAVISNVINLTDAVVYGVEVPGTEGKAGMAAIVNENSSIDLDKFLAGLKSNLPAYAVPLFLRMMKSLPLTGTFKLKKRDLQKEGYDINKIQDDVYFYNTKQNKYEKVTPEIYNDIISGTIRV